MADHLPSLALLITHYNRSESLERLLSKFEQLHITFGQIVVSDDASCAYHFNRVLQLQEKFKFKLATTKTNRGLGNNINKGQDLITVPYTLYIQEDFVPKEKFISVLSEAYKLMESDSKLDILRFYAYFKYPKTRKYNNVFSRMIYSPWTLSHIKFYIYSDHPHLRRSNFFNKFGRYTENVNANKTEFEMGLSFIKNHAYGLLYNEFTSVFDQINSSDEPSMVNKPNWKTRDNFPIQLLRKIYLPYRFIKNTIQLALK